jgi:acetyl esterase/lipase
MKAFAYLLALLGLFLTRPALADEPTDPKIVADVVYGHKDGMALTFDVLQPPKPNGAAVLAIQSGGWYSTWREPKELIPWSRPLLDKGFTVIILRHGSAPKYTVPEAVEDVRRAVRVIRMKAAEWGIDPERLGATGGSAGGHLTLMLSTTGDNGDPNAKDPVLRSPSRIAAGVALCPPTDIRTWPENPPDAIKAIPGLKSPLSFPAEKAAGVSPLLQVKENCAAVLLVHGDKDALVPIEHSTQMIEALKKARVKSDLLTIEGAGHSFSPDQNSKRIVPAMVAWFEEHLAAKKP